MDELLPWEVDGLPKEISRKDLEKAERYFMTGTFWWNDHLIPVAPDHHGAYFRLTGLRYEHNVKRLVKLIKNYKPMYSDSYCGLVAQHYFLFLRSVFLFQNADLVGARTKNATVADIRELA